MLEKLTGMISDKDAGYLDDLLKKDEKIRSQWEKIKKDFESHALQYVRDLNSEDAWEYVKGEIWEKRRLRKRRRRKWAVVTSIFIPLVAISLIFYTDSTFPVPEKRSVVNINSIKLNVAGTKTINLSQLNTSHNLPALKNVRLKLKKGSLSYTALDSSFGHTLNTLFIPATKTYKINLSDGTEVTLNAMTTLKFPFVFSGANREVWVNGEAYFRVAKDKSHPFIVHTPLTTIKVLGTEFNINTYDSLKVTTALVSGSVSAQAPEGHTIRLKPGFKAVFCRGESFKVNTFNIDNTLSWMRGIYYFRNASLEEITPVIWRWYGDTIVFEDTSAHLSRFTGALLKRRPLKEFLQNLVYTSDIHYYRKKGRIYISSK